MSHLTTLGNWLQLPSGHPRHKILGVKGGAGTGKTQLINDFQQYLARNVVVVAPTNKASKVLRTRGVSANTIHRLCMAAVVTGRTRTTLSPVLDPATLKPLLIDGVVKLKEVVEDLYDYAFAEAAILRKAREFTTIDAPQPLIMIIDESSMVSAQMWCDLITKTPHCRLIVVGDDNQLPPIEPEIDVTALRGQALLDYQARVPYIGFFAALTADIVLTTNHRQADGGDIIMVLDSILRTGTYPLPLSTAEVITFDLARHQKRLSECGAELAAHDIVLAHQKKTVERANTLIRRERHGALPPAEQELPRLGDRLYVTAPFKIDKQLVLCKGDTLTITAPPILDVAHGLAIIDCEVDDGTQRHGLSINLDFAGHRAPRRIACASVVYGFALTVHKAQGSQWDSVCFLDERLPYDRAKMLYTAASRAMNTLTIFTGILS